MAINYADYLSGIQNPLASAMQGYQMGQQMRENKLQRQALEAQAAEAKQNQLIAIQKQQEARQMQNALVSLSQKQDATPDDYISMMTRYPQLSEHLERPMSMMNEEQRKVAENQALNVYTALMSGNNDVAINLLQQKADAARNSGNEQEGQAADILMQSIRVNPEAAKTGMALQLAKTMGPERFASTYETLVDKYRDTLPDAEDGEDPIELKSADERAMYGQAAAFFGGIMDPISGEVSGLDPTVQPKVQAITTEAARLFKTGQAISRSEAVSMAARKLGIKVQDLSKEQQSDVDALLDLYPAR